MRNKCFRLHLGDYKNAHLVGVFEMLLEDLKGEKEEALKACMMESGDELLRAQGQARMLDDLILVLEGGTAPSQVRGISVEPTVETT